MVLPREGAQVEGRAQTPDAVKRSSCQALVMNREEKVRERMSGMPSRLDRGAGIGAHQRGDLTRAPRLGSDCDPHPGGRAPRKESRSPRPSSIQTRFLKGIIPLLQSNESKGNA